MKKRLALLFALSILTFGCAENSEDTIPDPVVPEISIDDEKSEKEEMGKKVIRTANRTKGRG